MRKMAKRAAERATQKSKAVPGRPAIQKISIDDYDVMFPRFKRFIRKEYDLSKAVFSNKERSEQVFESLFVRAWNTGKLSNVYYHDKKQIKADGHTYSQIWDDKQNAFKFVDTSDTHNVLWTNPQLEVQHRNTLYPIFDQYDTNATGSLDDSQLAALLREQMSADLTDGKQQNTQALDRLQTGYTNLLHRRDRPSLEPHEILAETGVEHLCQQRYHQLQRFP